MTGVSANRARRILLAAAVATVSLIDPSLAQRREDGPALERRYQQLYDRGDYGAALVEAQKLEGLIRQRFGTHRDNYAVALIHLAVVHKQLGRYAEAEDLFKRALATREQLLGARDPEIAKTLIHLAQVYD